MKHYTKDNLPDLLVALERPHHEGYYAMYSSMYDGIVTDPALMLIPVDDHMVHRGDGIFETFKCVDGSLYNLGAHLERLERSAAMLDYWVPFSRDELAEVVIETVHAGGHRDCLVRVLLSRGPGSFGVNPHDCPKHQLYVIACKAKEPFMVQHPEGARLGVSTIPVKPPFLAEVKHCNYLPNVLMKKEAVSLGVDFVAAFDVRGMLAEGATENIGIVTQQKELLFPKLDTILRGTTMIRVMELAKALVESGDLVKVDFANIDRADVEAAAEILVVGTTPNVTAVVEFDGTPVGGGRPGPVQEKLNALLLADIANNESIRTRVF